MPERSKGRSPRKCSLWFSMLGVGREVDDPTPKYLLLRNHAGGLDQNSVVPPAKNRKKKKYIVPFRTLAFIDRS
jgi:hypothetical protein